MITDHGTERLAGLCDCWRCSTGRPFPPSSREKLLKWDVAPLLAVTTDEILKNHFPYQRLIAWKNFGVPDHEADHAAMKVLRIHPDQIWRGWHTACFDYYPEPDPEEGGPG